MTKPVLIFKINGYVNENMLESTRDRIREFVDDEYHVIVMGNHMTFDSIVQPNVECK